MLYTTTGAAKRPPIDPQAMDESPAGHDHSAKHRFSV
jgi:hypothetical protein